MNNNHKILILDIETTGLSPQHNKIVEIGIVELDLKSGLKKVLYDKVIHETGITAEEVENSWIVHNSTLTTEEVRHSPNLFYEKEEIQNILNNYPLGCTAYNNAFDFGFMDSRGFAFPFKLQCPMLLLTPLAAIPGNKNGFKWPNCEEAYKFCFPESDFIELHRAADDSLHEADIVFWLFQKGYFQVPLLGQ